MVKIERELRDWRTKLEEDLAKLEEEHQHLLAKISKVRPQIEAIDQLLPSNQHGVSPPKTPSSTSSESVTPAHNYWPVILETLVELGDSARSEQVLDRVGQKLERVLTAADREMLPSGVDVRWRNRAAWQRYHMVRQGLLKSDSPRGVWEIAESGKRWLEEIRKRAASK